MIERFIDKAKESEETEVKNIEWLKRKIEEHIEPYEEEDYLSYSAGCTDVAGIILELIDQLDKPEVLSEEWVERNTSPVDDEGRLYVWKSDLQNAIVPKQEEVDQAYKDGYEKGKQHATEKQSEETETVAGVLVDYLIASAKLKLALSMEVEEMEE